jgi:hypothetical protein
MLRWILRAGALRLLGRRALAVLMVVDAVRLIRRPRGDRTVAVDDTHGRRVRGRR